MPTTHTSVAKQRADELVREKPEIARHCTDRADRIKEYIEAVLPSHLEAVVDVIITQKVSTACVAPKDAAKVAEIENTDISYGEAKDLIRQSDGEYIVFITGNETDLDKICLDDQLTADLSKQLALALHELLHILKTSFGPVNDLVEDEIEEQYQETVLELINITEDGTIENEAITGDVFTAQSTSRLTLAREVYTHSAEELIENHTGPIEVTFSKAVFRTLSDKIIYKSGFTDVLRDENDPRITFVSEEHKSAFENVYAEIPSLREDIFNLRSDDTDQKYTHDRHMSYLRAKQTIKFWKDVIKPNLSSESEDQQPPQNQQQNSDTQDETGDGNNSDQNQQDTQSSGGQSSPDQQNQQESPDNQGQGDNHSPEQLENQEQQDQQNESSSPGDTSEPQDESEITIDPDDHESEFQSIRSHPDVDSTPDKTEIESNLDDLDIDIEDLSEDPSESVDKQDNNPSSELDSTQSKNEPSTEDSPRENSNEDEESSEASTSPPDETNPTENSDSPTEATSKDEENSESESSGDQREQSSSDSTDSESNSPKSDLPSDSQKEKQQQEQAQASLDDFARSTPSKDESPSEEDGQTSSDTQSDSQSSPDSEPDTESQSKSDSPDDSDTTQESSPEADSSQEENPASTSNTNPEAQQQDESSSESPPEQDNQTQSSQESGPAHEDNDPSPEDFTGDKEQSHHEATENTVDQNALEQNLNQLEQNLNNANGASNADLKDLEIMPQTSKSISKDWQEMKNESMGTADTLAKTLNQNQQTNKRIGVSSGTNVNRRTAYKIGQGNPNIFERSTPGREKEYFIVILLDRSYSMKGGKIETAVKAVSQFSTACEELGIEVAIIDFYAATPRYVKPPSVETKHVLDTLLNTETQGGTPLKESLELAHDIAKDYRKQSIIISVTDDLAPNVEKIRKLFRQTTVPTCSLTIATSETRDSLPDSVKEMGEIYDQSATVYDQKNLSQQIDYLSSLLGNY